MDQESTNVARRPWERLWSGFLWGVIAFAWGTAFWAPGVLAMDWEVRHFAGMRVGGILFGVLGCIYGVRSTRTPAPPPWPRSVSFLMTALCCVMTLNVVLYVTSLITQRAINKKSVVVVLVVAGIAAPLAFIADRAVKRRSSYSRRDDAAT